MSHRRAHDFFEAQIRRTIELAQYGLGYILLSLDDHGVIQRTRAGSQAT
jgi:hypothetical protein